MLWLLLSGTSVGVRCEMQVCSKGVCNPRSAEDTHNSRVTHPL